MSRSPSALRESTTSTSGCPTVHSGSSRPGGSAPTAPAAWTPGGPVGPDVIGVDALRYLQADQLKLTGSAIILILVSHRSSPITILLGGVVVAFNRVRRPLLLPMVRTWLR